MVFGRGKPDLHHYHIQVNGHSVNPSKEVKFLGVTISQNLTWNTHINRAITKARRAINAIKLLSRQSWSTPKSQLIVAKALVRSRLTYGHEVYFTATQTLWKKLQSADVQAIKTALGLPNSANTVLVYQEAGWLPIKKRMPTTQRIFPNSTKHHPSSKPTHHQKSQHWRPDLPTQTPNLQKYHNLSPRQHQEAVVNQPDIPPGHRP